ncbi:MAG: hypothetical protein Q9222_003803 [Ikaeria aurantiellina]
MLLPIASPHPSTATAQDVPRDIGWVEAQNIPNLDYSAINSLEGEIRLLRVKKGLFRSDVVECELITTKSGQCPEFQALSYCCGPGPKTDIVLCKGKKLYIQSSLSAALKTFRESQKLKGQLLWTDGVSINQANKVEVGEQIPLMRRIYTEATGVFVHLGLAERQMSLGLDLMCRMNILQRHLKNPEESGAISLGEAKIPGGGRCWSEYHSLFLSPWISRTWILQEIALSQKATLGIGRYVTDWAVFEGSFHFIREQGLIESMFFAKEGVNYTINQQQPESRLFCNSQRVGSFGLTEGLASGLLNFIRLQEIREISRSPNKSSLLQVLRATRNFKVTDPRDKVLAVLGILKEIPAQLKDVSDYRLNTADIYHRTALYLCENSFLPDIWAHTGLQRRVGHINMPSWVPDWYADTNKLNERPLNLFRPTPFLAGGRPQGTCVIQAEEGKYPRAIMSPGFCHDEIIRKSDAYVPTELTPDDKRTTSQACFADNLIYEDVEKAFARTLLADDQYSGGNAIRSASAIIDVKATFRATLAQLEKKPDDLTGTSEAQVRTCSIEICPRCGLAASLSLIQDTHV